MCVQICSTTHAVTQTTPTALPAVIKKTIKNKIVEHNHMHIEHTHTSNTIQVQQCNQFIQMHH